MISKDFLKLVLAGKKHLMKMSEVKFIHVPKYDELAVKYLLPHLMKDATFMQFFPDKFPKGHPPDRTYFFNVLNTLNPEYMERVIRHANNKRNYVEEEAQ